MNRLSKIAGILAIALLLPITSQAQSVFSVHAVGVEGGLYTPDLDYYNEAPNFLLNFSSGSLIQGYLEAELFETVTLRGSIGYWSQDANEQIGLDDPDNARRHEATLRIVPLSGTLYYGLPTFSGFRPLIGAGVTQNFIERTFERERLNGETAAESFDTNGRSYTYHGLVGLHRQLSGPVWLGLEGRYVIGNFQEEDNADVAMNGWQGALSLRYQFGR